MAKKKKEHSSRSNYNNYLKGKEKLQHAVIQHPDEDPATSIFDYMKSATENNRQTWVVPYEKWQEKQKKYRE